MVNHQLIYNQLNGEDGDTDDDEGDDACEWASFIVIGSHIIVTSVTVSSAHRVKNFIRVKSLTVVKDFWPAFFPADFKMFTLHLLYGFWIRNITKLHH